MAPRLLSSFPNLQLLSSPAPPPRWLWLISFYRQKSSQKIKSYLLKNISNVSFNVCAVCLGHVTTCISHVAMSAVLPGSLVLSHCDVVVDVATFASAHEVHPLSRRDVRGRRLDISLFCLIMYLMPFCSFLMPFCSFSTELALYQNMRETSIKTFKIILKTCV